MFLQNSSQEVLQMEPITDKAKDMFLRNKRNAIIMHVGDTILDAAAESVIDENWCFIGNQSK